MILGGSGGGAAFNVPQGLGQQIGAHEHQAVKELPGSLKLADLCLGGIDHITGIHLTCQVHGADAGDPIPVEYCPLDGSGPPVPGQQGAMDIYGTVFRQSQNVIGQDAAVGHHHQDIRGQGLDLRIGGAVPHFLRLADRQAVGQGQLLHRGKSHLHAPALGLIRLGKDAHHVELLVQQLLQRGRRKIRRAHKHDTHQNSPVSISSSVSIRSHFWVKRMPSRWSSSWQKQRPVRPTPSTSNHWPFRSWARTFTL